LFDLSILKILVLGVLGLVIFGPEQLPRMAAQAGRALRDLRRLADSARADLTDSLGPEFRDFDFNDLNPRAFVRKHLLEDDESSHRSGDGAETPYAELPDHDPVPATLVAGEIPPYDSEAT
jgi:sec-independent protein translocase protein TatB